MYCASRAEEIHVNKLAVLHAVLHSASLPTLLGRVDVGLLAPTVGLARDVGNRRTPPSFGVEAHGPVQVCRKELSKFAERDFFAFFLFV